MPVHPAIAARFPLIRELQPGVDVDDVPESALAWFAPYGDYTLPDVAVEDRDIDGPHGPIPVRVYRPRNASGSRPGLLWNHGGGFTAGDLDMPEAQIVSAEIAARKGAVVVSVDYRLAVGGVRYPVPVDDVAAAWGWFRGAARELGVEPAHAAIGGASAGANLAVAATLRTRTPAIRCHRRCCSPTRPSTSRPRPCPTPSPPRCASCHRCCASPRG